MAQKGTLVKEIDVLFIARKIRLLGVAILTGISIVFLLGVFIPAGEFNKDLWMLNIISLVAGLLFCLPAYYIRNMMLEKMNKDNFGKVYFNAHVIPFALCDFGGLFCVATNLFVSRNILFAAGGFAVAVICVVLCFPRSDDYLRMKK